MAHTLTLTDAQVYHLRQLLAVTINEHLKYGDGNILTLQVYQRILEKLPRVERS